MCQNSDCSSRSALDGSICLVSDSDQRYRRECSTQKQIKKKQSHSLPDTCSIAKAVFRCLCLCVHQSVRICSLCAFYIGMARFFLFVSCFTWRAGARMTDLTRKKNNNTHVHNLSHCCRWQHTAFGSNNNKFEQNICPYWASVSSCCTRKIHANSVTGKTSVK